MKEGFKTKGIEFTVPNNTTSDAENIIKQLQEIGSQNKANAVGDNLIGKKPKLVDYQQGGKYLKKGGNSKCDSFGCPQVQYKSGSSIDQAITELDKSSSKQIKITNNMDGMANTINILTTGGEKTTSQKKKKSKHNNIMNIKKGGSKNYPVNINTNVPKTRQWSNPYTAAPNPSYNGGLYGASIGQNPLTADGPQFIGPWGNIPVTPTTTNEIHQNLKSATPPPGAMKHYIGTNRQGNNFMAMPEINWYNNTTNSNPGPFRLQGPSQYGGRKSKSKTQLKKSKTKNLKKSKKNVKKSKTTPIKKSKKQFKGGLSLYSSNMDCGAPFHPTWRKGYKPEVAQTSKPNMNTYTFIQDGGRKKKSKKKLKGGLSLYSSNMDCGAPFHPTWRKGYKPEVAATSKPNMNTYTFIQDGGSGIPHRNYCNCDGDFSRCCDNPQLYQQIETDEPTEDCIGCQTGLDRYSHTCGLCVDKPNKPFKYQSDDENIEQEIYNDVIETKYVQTIISKLEKKELNNIEEVKEYIDKDDKLNDEINDIYMNITEIPPEILANSPDTGEIIDRVREKVLDFLNEKCQAT